VPAISKSALGTAAYYRARVIQKVGSPKLSRRKLAKRWRGYSERTRRLIRPSLFMKESGNGRLSSIELELDKIRPAKDFGC